MPKHIRRAPPTSGSESSAPGNAATTEKTDLQETVGNSAVSEIVTTSDGDLQLPTTIRAQLLVSNERIEMAAAVFALSEQAETPSEEMLAIAAVENNRNDHIEQFPEDKEMFDDPEHRAEDPIYEAQAVDEQYETLHEAARFNEGFESTEDLQQALVSIEAAEQIERSGSPFDEEFITMTDSGERPLPEQTDAQSHEQIGQFHFWALDPAFLIAKEEEEEVVAPLVGGNDEPE